MQFAIYKKPAELPPKTCHSIRNDHWPRVPIFFLFETPIELFRFPLVSQVSLCWKTIVPTRYPITRLNTESGVVSVAQPRYLTMDVLIVKATRTERKGEGRTMEQQVIDATEYIYFGWRRKIWRSDTVIEARQMESGIENRESRIASKGLKSISIYRTIGRTGR